MRNSVFLAALTAALVLGCRRAPSEEPSAPPRENPAAPDPSSTMITLPLSKSATGYTNEMQAAYLQQQAANLGIKRFAPVTHLGSEDAPDPLTYQEGLERTREMSAALAAQRRAIDGGKPKSVDLSGMTPRLLQPTASGDAPVSAGSQTP